MKRLAGRAGRPRRARSWAASLLAVLMILSLLPVRAFAAEMGVFAEAAAGEVRTEDAADAIEDGHFYMSLMRTAAYSGYGADDLSGFELQDEQFPFGIEGNTDVIMQIIWNDDDDVAGKRPDSVAVQLLRDGGISTNSSNDYMNNALFGNPVTITAGDAVSANEWQYTLPCLADNHVYNACLADTLPAGYTTRIAVETGASENGSPFVICKIVNSYAGQLVDVTVSTIWIDEGNEDKRPSYVNLKLTGPSYATGSISMSSLYTDYRRAYAADDYSYTWHDLDGRFAWNIETSSDTVAEGYSSVFITGEPEISENGNEHLIFYCINTYIGDPNYVSTYDLSVQVEWDDDDDAAGMRPANFNVTLHENGNRVMRDFYTDDNSRTLSAKNGWAAKWTSKSSSSLWTVAVNSRPFAGYTSRFKIERNVSGDGRVSIDCVIVNTYTGVVVASTDVTVKIDWQNENGDTSLRPDTMVAWLLCNGERVRSSSASLSERNKWTYTWSDCDYKSTLRPTNALPGECIWSVELSAFQPDGFTSVLPNGYESDVIITAGVSSDDVSKEYVNYTMINRYTGETSDKIDLTATNIWSGDGAYDRPESAVVYLTCDGVDVTDLNFQGKVTLTEKSKWTHTWRNLDGRYTWDVRLIDPFENYYTEITSETRPVEGDDAVAVQKICNIVNTPKVPVPETASVIATVVWSDKDAGSRPGSVRVKLICDGEDYDGEDAIAYLTADNDWTYEWKKLDGRHEWSAHTADPSPEGYTTSHATKAYAVDAGNGPHGYVVCNISNAHEDVIHTEYDWWGDQYSYVDAFAVKKVWFGGDASKLDSVGVTLVDTSWSETREDVVLNGDSWWNYIWYGIGSSYEYLSIEEKTPDPYISKVMYNGTACVVANIPEAPDTPDGGFALPDTGGIGVYNLILIGSVLAMASLLVLAADRRKARG